MRGLWVVAFLAVLLASCTPAAPPARPSASDEDLARLLAGPWHPAPDSDDAGEFIEEVFSADGAYAANTYADKDCRKLASSADFKWKIEKGILYTGAPDTDEMSQDDILVLDEERLKTRSKESNQFFSRLRGYLCPERAERQPKLPPHTTEAKPGDTPTNKPR